MLGGREAQRVPYRINPRRNTPRHIVIKVAKIKDKEKYAKSSKEILKETMEKAATYDGTTEYELKVQNAVNLAEKVLEGKYKKAYDYIGSTNMIEDCIALYELHKDDIDAKDREYAEELIKLARKPELSELFTEKQMNRIEKRTEELEKVALGDSNKALQKAVENLRDELLSEDFRGNVERVDVKFLRADRDEISMSNGVLKDGGLLVRGEKRDLLILDFKIMTVGGKNAHLLDLSVFKDQIGRAHV